MGYRMFSYWGLENDQNVLGRDAIVTKGPHLILVIKINFLAISCIYYKINISTQKCSTKNTVQKVAHGSHINTSTVGHVLPLSFVFPLCRTKVST